MIGALDELDTPPCATSRRRKALMPRKHIPWATDTKPMLGDGTSYDDSMVLVELRKDLEREVRIGELRNGAIPVEYQLAMALR